MGAFDDLIPGNAKATSSGVFDDLIPSRLYGGDVLDGMKDVAKSVGSGAVRGVAAWLGTPATLANVLERAVHLGEQAYEGETDEQYTARLAERKANAVLPDFLPEVSAENIQADLERNLTGPLHQPRTRAGKFVERAVEFVPSALAGPGGVVRNAITYGAVPGLASEAAGQMTEGSPVEPYARGVAAVGAGLSGAAVTRATNPARIARQAMPDVTPAQLDAAEALFRDAQAMGMPLSRPEAVQHVTQGATRLADLQRVVEGQGGMRAFYAQRPGQVEQAGRQAFENIAPATPEPSMIGPQVGQAAEGQIGEVQGRINTATRPLYQRAEQKRLDPQSYASIRNDPVWKEGVSRVRRDPFVGPQIAQYPDDSIVVADEVKKLLDETGRNFRDPGNASRSNRAADIVEQGRDRVVSAADQATGSRPGVMGDYEMARAIQAGARQKFLEPLMRGPLGKMAANDTTTKQAIDALFPVNPVPNSAQEVETAMRALVKRNPMAARHLVRSHAESVFNEATQRLQSGANEFGGALFAAVLRGNPQQAQNLEVAVRALPSGDAIWPGFNRFLEVLEASGQRQRIGSQTAFNAEAMSDLKRGRLSSEAATGAAGLGVKWPQRIQETVQRWRLGNGVNELATLFTSPEATKRFRQIAELQSGSREAMMLAGRLVVLATVNRSGKGE